MPTRAVAGSLPKLPPSHHFIPLSIPVKRRLSLLSASNAGSPQPHIQSLQHAPSQSRPLWHPDPGVYLALSGIGQTQYHFPRSFSRSKMVGYTLCGDPNGLTRLVLLRSLVTLILVTRLPERSSHDGSFSSFRALAVPKLRLPASSCMVPHSLITSREIGSDLGLLGPFCTAIPEGYRMAHECVGVVRRIVLLLYV